MKNRKLRDLILLLGICLIVVLSIIILKNNQSVVVFPKQESQSTSEVEQPQNLPSIVPISFTKAKVIKVYDGDTIEIEGGEKVRYIGIDTTEVYPVKQCFSEEAKNENEKLVFGKEVQLVKDVSETDKYGRLLRYIYVGNEFINDDLVKSGFAKVMTVPPDVKFKDEFLNSENYAKENKLGLWGKCF